MRTLKDEQIIKQLEVAKENNYISEYVYNYCVEAIEERTAASIKFGLEKFPNYLNWGNKI